MVVIAASWKAQYCVKPNIEDDLWLIETYHKALWFIIDSTEICYRDMIFNWIQFEWHGVTTGVLLYNWYDRVSSKSIQDVGMVVPFSLPLKSEIILCMDPANERRRCILQNDPWNYWLVSHHPQVPTHDYQTVLIVVSNRVYHGVDLSDPGSIQAMGIVMETVGILS